MNIAAKLFIGITSVLHILFFKLESIDFLKPEILARFNLTPETAIYAKDWAFNQGFYNLFLAIGLIYTIYLLQKQKIEIAKHLGKVLLLIIVGAGVVLFLSTGKVAASVAQSIPAILAYLTLHFGFKEELKI